MEAIGQGQKTAERFFTSENASTYDYIVRFTTFGQDHLWKDHMVKIINNQHMCILDLACGTGILSSMLIKRIPSIRVVGLDLISEYLQIAKAKKNNSLLVNGAAETLPFANQSFDCIISSYLPKYVNIDLLIDECCRILKHRGIVIFHDFTYPQNFMVQYMWKAYFAILRFMANFIKSWNIVFSELDKVIQTNNWPNHILRSLETKGFDEIYYKNYTLGTAAIISAKKI